MSARQRILGSATARLVAIITLGGALTACADAPVTADQLQADGQLRNPALEQSAFSAQDRTTTQRAAQISAILAAEAEGALFDTNSFSADVGQIHLHLRADGIDGQRPVVFRWTHRGSAASMEGTLTPGDSMALAASLPVDPERTGPWRVEILGAPSPGGEPVVLFERDFEISVPSH